MGTEIDERAVIPFCAPDIFQKQNARLLNAAFAIMQVLALLMFATLWYFNYVKKVRTRNFVLITNKFISFETKISLKNLFSLLLPHHKCQVLRNA